MPPAVAAHAITTYTRPGDTVLDPGCGAGTVMIAALRFGLDAIGLTGRRRWWPVASARTAPGTRAFLNRFEQQVDPCRKLPPEIRAQLAQSARTAYMLRLARLAAEARRRKRQSK